MKNKIISIFICSLLSLCFTGCETRQVPQASDSGSQTNTDKYIAMESNPTSFHKNQIQDKVYLYNPSEDKYIEGVELENDRWIANVKEQFIPVITKSDRIVMHKNYANSLDIYKVDDLGYTIGTDFVSTENNAVIIGDNQYDSKSTQSLSIIKAANESKDISLISFDGKSLNNIPFTETYEGTNSFCIYGLDNDTKYEIGYQKIDMSDSNSTENVETKTTLINADIHLFKKRDKITVSSEDNLIDSNKNLAVTLADTFESGYYYIESVGLFYYNAETEDHYIPKSLGLTEEEISSGCFFLNSQDGLLYNGPNVVIVDNTHLLMMTDEEYRIPTVTPNDKIVMLGKDMNLSSIELIPFTDYGYTIGISFVNSYDWSGITFSNECVLNSEAIRSLNDAVVGDILFVNDNEIKIDELKSINTKQGTYMYMTNLERFGTYTFKDAYAEYPLQADCKLFVSEDNNITIWDVDQGDDKRRIATLPDDIKSGYYYSSVLGLFFVSQK